MSERPASPTPSEQARLDADASVKEASEQATLPYKWTQTISDLELTMTIPANLKAKDLNVTLTKTKIYAGIKGKEPFIDVCSL